MAHDEFDPTKLENIWKDYRQQPASWINSLLVHLAILSAIALPYLIGPVVRHMKQRSAVTPIYFPEQYRLAVASNDGGGGGAREPLPASKGIIPPFSPMPLAPPSTHPLENPQLPVQASLLGPLELKLPEMSGANIWGDPHGVPGPPSDGPGCCGGIGDGNGPGGVGPSNGPGYGPGPGGPGVFSVGGDVTAPIAIYRPEPPYTEQARKAKLAGLVTLSLIVDAQGIPRNIRVMRSLGMGLDEQAMQTVSTWKFKPAMRNHDPVAVSLLVEITFRLF